MNHYRSLLEIHDDDELDLSPYRLHQILLDDMMLEAGKEEQDYIIEAYGITPETTWKNIERLIEEAKEEVLDHYRTKNRIKEHNEQHHKSQVQKGRNSKDDTQHRR